MSKIKNSKSQIRLPLFLAIGISAGIFIGASMAEKDNSVISIFDNSAKFKEVLGHVERSYVDDVDTDELVEGAIVNMLSKLDPHSSYINAEDLAIMNSQLQGNYDGIGIQFDIIRDTIYVISPLGGGPSERLGLLSGDKIIVVDDETVAGIGITSRGVMDRLLGPKGTSVKVEILREKTEELIEYNIIRDKIPIYSVDVGYMVDDEIGYIKVNKFSSTTYNEFKSKLMELKQKGMKKLVLDLKGNTGGYMSAAINMADELLSIDRVIVSQSGREERSNMKSLARRKGVFEQGPVIVLVNEGSASAAEIVAGALQDNDRALIVGRRSYGKGLVQMPFPLRDNSELRLVIARYYTPSGRSIQKPYNGNENYGDDINERYNHGEFFHADSIKFNDSLKYKTLKGRTVYGGGGIMPDFFVPFDTTSISDYYRNLFAKNVVREYTLEYYRSHKENLEKMGFDKFYSEFEVSDDMLIALARIGEEVGLEFDKTGLEKSSKDLKIHIKAQIARSVWGEDGFFPIFNQTDEIFNRALKLFDEAEQLALAE